MTSTTDSIKREILLRATRARVWQALSNAEEFGAWFGIALDGTPFAPGARVSGHSTYPGYEHVEFDFLIEQMEPEQLLAIRWRPDADDPAGDLSPERTTLAVFRLEEAPEGTVLHFEESGYDKIPAEKREKIFRGNSEGWDIQMKNIEKHVSGS